MGLLPDVLPYGICDSLYKRSADYFFPASEPEARVLPSAGESSLGRKKVIDVIYHLLPASELYSLKNKNEYIPPGFSADGFIHCSEGRSMTLAVARDYFLSHPERMFVLEINCRILKSELIYEAPSPIPGGGTEHLENDALFPHLYGPLNLDAVQGAGLLEKNESSFAWPGEFLPLAKVFNLFPL